MAGMLTTMFDFGPPNATQAVHSEDAIFADFVTARFQKFHICTMTVSSYIKQDVIARIAKRQIRPGELTLEDLSRRYEVSFTPVRTAVKSLISEGYLIRENGRLAVCPDREINLAEQTVPEHPRDLFKLAADDFIRLSLTGEAVLLREESTAEKYGVSRSAIRQVFNRLVGDGILEHLPRRGWQLRPFRESDLDDYIAIREVLDLKALALAWPRLVDEDIQRMIDLHHLPNLADGAPRIDHSLHDYLIDKAGNRYITEFFERHGPFFAALLDWEELDREAAVQTVREHLAILNALLQRDRPAAERALSDHIHNHHSLLRQRVRSHGAHDPAGK
jgi:DNA-binding GntR family transcriptional regulator